MRRKTFVLFGVLLTISVFSSLAGARSRAAYLGSNEKIRPNGEYIVYVFQAGEWKEAGSLAFDRFFNNREIELRGYLPADNVARIRLVQRGGSAAHIDAVLLGDMPPKELKGIDDDLALKKLSKRDFDVVDAFNTSAEFVFLNSGNHTILSITARVEAETISKTPFQFPSENLFQKIEQDSCFYTYRLNSGKNIPPDEPVPFFKEYCLTGSGHPSGYTYGWVSNDDKSLYVKIDFTPDNTLDGDKDYAKVYAKTEAGIKEFTVSVPETRRGEHDFTYTQRVPYQHKVYNFKIPLDELGVKGENRGKELHLAFSAYGTAAPAAPGISYVDISNGTDDLGHGTSPGAGAWKTLHYAIQQINGGTPGNYALYVAPGTYSVDNGEDNTNLTITQGNVTVIGDFTSKPILSGPTNPQAGEWAAGITTIGHNITIRDLEIQNFSNVGIHVQGDGTAIYNCDVHNNGTTGIVINTDGTVNGGTIKRCDVHNNQTGIGIIDAQNIVVEQNYVHDNIAITTGIHVSFATNGVEIKKNLVESNGTGIQIYGCSPLVERNEIKDNATGIRITGDTDFTASPKIYNNLIYDTSSTMNDGIIVEGTLGSTASPPIYHNTIDGGSSNGIEVYGDSGCCGTPDILFNIITNFGTYGIYNDGGAPTIDYNDVWNNSTANYYGCPPGARDIAQDPLYATSYGLQNGSPCKDAIPTTDPPNDPVTRDLSGYKRPRDNGYDMGAYEYVSDITHNYNLPGGTGQVTDYRMFTVPVYVGTGSDLKSTMESYVGAYNKCQWRVFDGYDGSNYLEMDSAGFSSLAVGPGDAFWAISLGTDLIPFSGRPAPDGAYYTIPLNPGWNLVGLPWPKYFPDIELGKIAVSDGVNNSWITSPNNTLTQKSIWDYTGSGPSNGYVQLTAAGDVLKPGSGYWINVLVTSPPVKLLVPPDNGGGYFYANGDVFWTVSGSSGGLPPPPDGLSCDYSRLTITRDGAGSGTVASDPAGIDCGADCSEDYLRGTNVTLTATPDPASALDGWSGADCPGNGDCTLFMDQDYTVTATFNPDGDLDGISDAMEDAGPNGGDGNSDGVLHIGNRHRAQGGRGHGQPLDRSRARAEMVPRGISRGQGCRSGSWPGDQGDPHSAQERYNHLHLLQIRPDSRESRGSLVWVPLQWDDRCEDRSRGNADEDLPPFQGRPEG
jgi:hypothetical protein